MSDETTNYGSIQVSPHAVATIVYEAAQRSYGVVGLASKNTVTGITHAIVKDPTHGIEVDFDGNKIDIDVYIIVQYGTRISSVANSVANTVRYQVEKAMGVTVNEINVHVRDLRVSNDEE